MQPIPPPPEGDVNPLTGNRKASTVTDVNTILRALMQRKRITRLDLLGRTDDHTSE